MVDDQGTVHPGGGWTDVVDHARAGRPGGRRPAHGMARTGGHAPGDARGGRRPASARRRPTRRHSPAGTCGTSSATATCCFPTLDADDDGRRVGRRRGRGRAATADRAARRVVRRSAAGRCERRRHRHRSRHHGERRSPAPDRVGRPRARGAGESAASDESAAVSRPAGPVVPRHRTGRRAVPQGLRSADQRAARLPRRRVDSSRSTGCSRGGATTGSTPPGHGWPASDRSARRSRNWPTSSTRTGTWPRPSRSDAARYRVVEHNCAIASVARRYGQACVERDRLHPCRAARGTTVERVSTW